MIKTGPRRVLVNLFEASILLVLLLLAAYVSIGRLVISQVDMFRETIEARLSSVLQVPVHIASLQGDWSYLDPSIIINGFSIGTSTDAGITFDRMSLRINSVLSLAEADLVISDLAVDRLSFRLQQNADGVWAIDGLPARDSRLNLEPLLASVPHLKSVELTQVDIDIVGLQAHYQIRNQVDQEFELVADGDAHSMSLPLLVERLGDTPYTDSIQLLGKYAGDPRDQEAFSASLYLQLPNLEMMDLLPTISIADTQITKLGLSGEFWLEFHHGAFELIGSTVSHLLEGQRQGRAVEVLSDLRSEFAIVGLGDNEIQWYFNTLSMNVGAERWVLDESSVVLKQRDDDLDLVVYSPDLSITTISKGLVSLSQRTGLLTDAGYRMLVGVQPRGALEEVYLAIEDLTTSPKPHLVAQISNLQLDAHEALPGISRLDGLASLGRNGGYMNFHNTQPFTLNFKSMFPAPWPFDTAHGQLRYQLTPDAVLVESGLLRVTEAGMVGGGRVQLRLPENRDEHTWGLEVGVRDADLLNVHRYLPAILSPALLELLGGAINKGSAGQTGMVFHGTLFRDAPKIQKVHELYFDVVGAELDYDSSWPVLEDVNAVVYVNNSSVTAAGATGVLLENRLQQVALNVPISLDGSADSILIDTVIQGKLSQGIRLLNETPISDLTRQMAESWRAQGSMSGKLQLDVPVGKRAGEPIGVDVSIDLSGGDLLMKNVNLSIENIKGQIRYETSKGVSAEPFTAMIFDEPVVATIESMKNQQGVVDEIRIASRGSVSTQDLHDWSGQALLTRTEGKLNYETVIHVPTGDSQSSMTVEAHSDLQGVVVHLPPPMEKLSGEAVSFDYHQTFYDDGYEVGIQLDNAVKGLIKIRENQLVGGRLHFGPTLLGAVTFDALRVTGELETVDYTRWIQLSTDLEDATQDSLSSELKSRLDFVAIHANLLLADSLELEDIDVHISRVNDAWRVDLMNELLGGLLTIPDQDDQLLVARLDYMALEGDDTDIDPMGNIDPRKLPAVDFSVKRLTVGGEDYGRWAFKFRPTSAGGLVSDLSAWVKNVEIEAGSKIEWSVAQGQNMSQFSGVVKVPELGPALTAWGYAASIEGKSFTFSGDLEWPGSPVMCAIDSVSGDMRLDAKEGRFVQAESGAGALKLLGIFDFASLANRFLFDFSDIVDEGFSFKTIEGSSRFNQGSVDVIEPIVITGSGGIFRLGGRIDLTTSTLDNDMIVTLPVSQNMPWYAAYSALTNPLLGAGVLLAQKVFESQINQLASAKYKVSGTMDEPIIEFVSIFSDSVREPAKAETVVTPALAPSGVPMSDKPEMQ